MIQFVRNNPQIAGLVALVVIALAGLGVYRAVRPPPPILDAYAKVWCYDLGSGKVFVASESDVPPFVAPSGSLPDGSSSGVRAEVYSCGSCSDPATHFVAWLWKFNPAIHDKVAQVIAASPNGLGESNPYINYSVWGDKDAKLLASVDSKDRWLPESSNAARELIAKLGKKCPAGQAPTPCVAK